MRVQVEITETSYGVILLEDVPDGATAGEIRKLAEEAYYGGCTNWDGGDYEIGQMTIDG